MNDERFNKLCRQTFKCPRGQAVFCDGTPNLSQKDSKKMKACRYVKNGKCNKPEGEEKG